MTVFYFSATFKQRCKSSRAGTGCLGGEKADILGFKHMTVP